MTKDEEKQVEYQIRYNAMEFAIRTSNNVDSTKDIVDRATAFQKFLKGKK